MVAEPQLAEQASDLSCLGCATTAHSPWPMATVEGGSYIVRYANPAFCRLMGKEKEELEGKSFLKLMRANEEFIVMLYRVFCTGKPESRTEERESTPDLVFWSYTIWPVTVEEKRLGVMVHVTESARFHTTAVALNEALVIGSVRQHELVDAAEVLNEQLRAEIEQRIWTEDALRASEERFRVLFNLGPVAIFSCDRKGAIQNYNRRAAELWGRNPKCGADGEHFTSLLRFHETDGRPLPQTQSPIAEVLKGGVFAKEDDVFIARPDGAEIAAAVTFVPLKDRADEITGGIAAFYDVTERRMLEDSLLARARDLVEADRSKDEFLAMLAHELRNPLAPLRNAAEILDVPDASEQERALAQGILARQIENMSRMVNDLLDVSRITEGKIDLRMEVAELGAIVKEAASLARPGVGVRAQHLTVNLPKEPIFLNADTTRLEQVFGNLLTNASKYTLIGGHISLTAECSSSEKGPAEVIVRVRDDGMGIAPELLPHIFDLFVQATRALDRNYGGLGIGLTLVQRLVKLHGGTVEARSEGLDQGSEFIVRLPILREAPASAAPPASVVREAPCRMLIVDDNQDSARSMSTLQRLRGHETRSVFTGPDAVVLAGEFLPEVVLLDIGLPGMDGFEVARRLRAMPEMEKTLIVAMTGYGSDEDRTQARDAGFDEYLVKPVDLELLRGWLRARSVDGKHQSLPAGRSAR